MHRLFIYPADTGTARQPWTPGDTPGDSSSGKKSEHFQELLNLKNGFIEVTIDLYRVMKQIKGKNIDKRSHVQISEKKKRRGLHLVHLARPFYKF